MSYAIGLPNGKKCSISTYCKAWRTLKTLPPEQEIAGWEWYPVPARDILRELKRGLNDRINRKLPGYGRGRKWDYQWQIEAYRLGQKVNTPRLIVRLREIPAEFRARLAGRSYTEEAF